MGKSQRVFLCHATALALCPLPILQRLGRTLCSRGLFYRDVFISTMVKFKIDEAKRQDKVNDIIKATNEFAIKNDNFIFCSQEGEFYHWADNFWQKVHDLKFEKWIMDREEVFMYMGRTKRQEAIHSLKLIKQMELSDFNCGDILDLKNGVYNVKEYKFMEHDKKYLSNIRIPYDYDALAQCERWVSFVNECLEGNAERVSVLQEFMGYCLGRDNSFHKCLILIGDGRNGKGTTFHIIRKMLGENNCTSLKLGQMMNENMAARLANKLVNIDADTDTSARKYESDFRRITGGDTIMVKNLYENPFELTPYVRLVIGANDLPHIADKTHGLYDRLIIIPYNVSFMGREDFYLKEKMEAEISGIFNWALEGRKRLYERGRFIETIEVKELIDELKRQNNPIEAFVDECVGVHDDANITKRQMFDAYYEWCKQNNNHPFSMIKFGKELFRVCGRYTKKNERESNTIGNSPIWPQLYIKGKWSPVEKAKEWQE